MGSPSKALLLLLLSAILLVTLRHCDALAAKNTADGKEILHEGANEPKDDKVDSLTVLVDNDDEDGVKREVKEEEDEDDDEEDDDNEGEDFEGTTLADGTEEEEEEEEEEEPKEVDEKDVVVLSASNFTDFLNSHHYVMVEFFAPWCGYCQALAPEYAEAATTLKDVAVLAKVDATIEEDLAQKFDIEGYPTVLFFVDGVSKEYSGNKQKDDIVAWVKKRTGPPVTTISSKEDVEKIVETLKAPVAIAYIEDLTGKESEEFAAAARQDDDVTFYETDDKDLVKVFNFPIDKKPPALVLLKQEEEKVAWFDGSFERDELVRFVEGNKLPLIIYLSKESARQIFDAPIKKQVLLFSHKDELDKVIPALKAVSKTFSGKIVFVYVDLDDKEQVTGVAEFFGISADKTTVMGYESQENGRKFLLEGDISVETMKKFAEDFLEDKLVPYLKSAPIPETNDGPVKIVVGSNLDEIVLDESTDCFLEIYAPWCGHCQALDPTWTKLGKRLASVKSIVIAKMDGTTNEHPRAKSDGFPTLLFFPAGKKSFDPITYDGERTLKDFVKFLKKEAAIPFTIPKRPSVTTEDNKSDGQNDAQDRSMDGAVSAGVTDTGKSGEVSEQFDSATISEKIQQVVKSSAELVKDEL